MYCCIYTPAVTDSVFMRRFRVQATKQASLFCYSEKPLGQAGSRCNTAKSDEYEDRKLA